MTIGERIRETRLDRKMTLEELARIIGVSKPTMQRYECGVITMTTDRVMLIARALDVDPNYLMGWTAERKESPAPSIDSQIIEAAGHVPEDRKPEALRYLRFLSNQADI